MAAKERTGHIDFLQNLPGARPRLRSSSPLRPLRSLAAKKPALNPGWRAALDLGILQPMNRRQFLHRSTVATVGVIGFPAILRSASPNSSDGWEVPGLG